MEEHSNTDTPSYRKVVIEERDAYMADQNFVPVAWSIICNIIVKSGGGRGDGTRTRSPLLWCPLLKRPKYTESKSASSASPLLDGKTNMNSNNIAAEGLWTMDVWCDIVHSILSLMSFSDESLPCSISM